MTNAARRSTRSITVRSEPLHWTPAMVAEFWDLQAGRTDLHETYFSRLLGEQLITFVRQYVAELGEVADFGAGPGYLLEGLLTRAIQIDSTFDGTDEARRVLESMSQ